MKCEKCKNKSNNTKTINTECLRCRHQYPGQECFDKKPDLFEPKEEEQS